MTRHVQNCACGLDDCSLPVAWRSGSCNSFGFQLLRQKLLSSINYQNFSQNFHRIPPMASLNLWGFIDSEFRNSLNTVQYKCFCHHCGTKSQQRSTLRYFLTIFGHRGARILMVGASIGSKVVNNLID